MGLFDSVYADCPTCGKPVEFQSKVSECQMNSFTPKSAPADVLFDVINEPEYCRHCDTWSVLYDPRYPPGYEPPKPSPQMRKVRTPDNPGIHQSQPFIRWWTGQFSESHIIDDEPAARQYGQGE